MNKNMSMLDFITIISFLIGLYALGIAIENLVENEDQNKELKEILHYLEQHLHKQDTHLEAQDELIKELSK